MENQSEMQMISIRAFKNTVDGFKMYCDNKNCSQGEGLTELVKIGLEKQKKQQELIKLTVANTNTKQFENIQFSGKLVLEYNKKTSELGDIMNNTPSDFYKSMSIYFPESPFFNYKYVVYEKSNINNPDTNIDFLIFEKLDIYTDSDSLMMQGNLTSSHSRYFLNSQVDLLKELIIELNPDEEIELMSIIAPVKNI